MDSPTTRKGWIEDAISSNHMTVYDFNSFSEIEHISTTSFTDVKRACQIGLCRNAQQVF
ncbi:5780_t:CDS:2 [Acaulospora morrowiae]|uniref:5780_t:CDS:1 n=1 Tax=Acaulospora morrowiae TaxID=94023 RepID=A0A9N8VLQ3_9GLOM|nr:5780_t:CDS:2 [Acaulospora morrowiae]